MAKRTTMRSSKGTKLYAVRDKKGRFEDIQTYKRAHTMDMKRKSKSETAAGAAKPPRSSASPSGTCASSNCNSLAHGLPPRARSGVARTSVTSGARRLGDAYACGPEPETLGLLALMLLTEARRPARVSAGGELVALDEQDRGAWDAALIAEGHRLVRERLAAAAEPTIASSSGQLTSKSSRSEAWLAYISSPAFA